jgi:glycosyltransferase involved in cell wall biosynthesis
VRQLTQSVARFPVNACALCTNACSPELDAHKAYMVQGFDRYADAIYSLNPDLLWVLPERAEFMPYATIDLREWEPEPLPQRDTFTILHAPTNRGVKGTPRVLEAVEALKSRHPEVELLLVENVPHDEVRAMYARADLVIDQLLLGWYGGFAVEAMALGRPVMCYLREEDLHFIPAQMREQMPIINATPDSIDEVLEAVFLDRASLAERGRLSRSYVEMWHDPLKIAQGTKATYERILGR